MAADGGAGPAGLGRRQYRSTAVVWRMVNKGLMALSWWPTERPGGTRMRVTTAFAAALALWASAGAAQAQANYPDKPIRILVGFPAGVAPDVTMRLFGDKWNESWTRGVTV